MNKLFDNGDMEAAEEVAVRSGQRYPTPERTAISEVTMRTV